MDYYLQNSIKYKESENMGFWDNLAKEASFSSASGEGLPYVVLQVTLKKIDWNWFR